MKRIVSYFIGGLGALAMACTGASPDIANSNPQPCPKAAPVEVATAVASVSVSPPAPSISMSASNPTPPSPASLLDPALVQQANQLRDTVLASSKAYEWVRSLTDEAGHRLAGSPGNKKAIAWALRTLKELGFSNVRAEEAKAVHWERGPASVQILSPHEHQLAVLAMGGSVATPKQGIEAEVIMTDSMEALSRLDKKAVEGKIVFVFQQMQRTQDGSGYSPVGRIRARSASEAAKLGAKAVLIRSAGTDSTRFPHTGGLSYADGVPKIPAGALSVPDAEMLKRMIESNPQKPVKIRMHIAAKDHGEVSAPNVVGEIVGQGAPEEVILLGGHLDSWDVGVGAVDDGAGCAAIIEAARQIGQLKQKPRRTIRVVLFNNEENGLGGAKAYAKEHALHMDNHKLAMEADLGAGRVFKMHYAGDASKREWFDAVASLVSGPLGIAVTQEEAKGGADLIPLGPARVPMIDLHQDASLYFDLHHTENDTLDKINKGDLDQVAAAYATVAYAVAQMPADFGRVPKKVITK